MMSNSEKIDIMHLIKEKASDNKISCADAFKIVNQHAIFPDILGQAIDHSGMKISNCQIGLFGYGEKKKILEPAESTEDEMEDKIYANLENGKLTCAAIWNIAEELSVKKIDVAAACEKLKVKISVCQLGAF